jgi:hypothetical protein
MIRLNMSYRSGASFPRATPDGSAEFGFSDFLSSAGYRTLAFESGWLRDTTSLILFISALSSAEVRGAITFLSKPFNCDALLDSLSSARR